MPRVLENVMSWDELTLYTTNRIKKMNPTKFNPTDFYDWMMLRKGRGYLFDVQLIYHLYRVSKNMRADYDHLIVIAGKEGEGKSTLGTQICSWIDLSFSAEDICLDGKQYLKRLQDKKQLQAIQLDEAGLDLFSRKAMSAMNTLLVQTFMVMRQRQLFACLCLPNFHLIDSYVRDHRINTLIQVRKRGSYRGFLPIAIRKISKDGAKYKKVMNVRIPSGQFWDGDFRKEFPHDLPKEDYIKRKEDHIQEFLTRANDSQTKLNGDSKFIKITELAQKLGVGTQTLRDRIYLGEIKFRKFGSHYSIPAEEAKRIEIEGFS